MRYRFQALALATACCVLLVLAGCGSGPSARLNGFLEALRDSRESDASSFCYDRNSFKDVSEALEGQLNGAQVKIVSEEAPGDGDVREKGYTVKKVASIEERMSKPQAEIEARFKPLIEQANAVLSNAQAEYNNAVEMKKYAAVTYGTNMPQYYAEQVRINNALPRVRNAQARVDELNAAKAAELAALKAGAEAGYRQEKDEAAKALAKNSVEMPTCVIRAELKQGTSTQQRTFTMVEDGSWKVYSVETGK